MLNENIKNKPFVITGFGPFGDIKENPSQKLVNELNKLLPNETFAFQILPVSYSYCEKWAEENLTEKNKLVIHFGVAAQSKSIRLEKQAKNIVGNGIDVEKKSKEGVIDLSIGDTIQTCLDVDRLVYLAQINNFPCEISENAGDYLCNFLYFKSLKKLSSRNVLFVHIPQEDIVKTKKMVEFTVWLIGNLQSQAELFPN